MRIVVPATPDGLRPEVLPAIMRIGVTRPIEVWPLHTDEAYWRLLDYLWDEQDTVIIVEHDIVVDDGVIEGLAACEGLWCAHAYPFLANTHVGLGCVKFSGDLMKTHPHVMDVVGRMSDYWHPEKHWCRLDAWMRNTLNDEGVYVHEHAGLVSHLSTAASHGCLQ